MRGILPGAMVRSSWAATTVAGALVVTALAGSGYAIAPVRADGRVVDVAGRPVPGATAQLVEAGSVITVGTTDASGGFHLSGGIHLRQPLLVVSAPGYLPASEAVAATTVLHRRPLVRGRAFDGGTALGQVHVELELAGGATLETMTAGDGSFSFRDGVLPGPALVTVVAPDRDAYRERLFLEADHAEEVAAAMPVQAAYLDLVSTPAGVAPQVDGAALPGCPATPCAVAVPPGNHTVGIADGLYVPWSEPVTLFEGTHLAITIPLQRKTGTLRVAGPGDGDGVLVVDGQQVPSGGWSGVVPTGQHTISYSSAERWPWATTVNVDWNQETDVSVAAPVVDTSSDAAFMAGMSRYLDSLPGQYSVYLSTLQGARVLTYNASAAMEAASVIKLPLAIYVEQQAQAGQLKMDDKVELQDGDFMGGTGTLDGTASSGDKYSYHDLLSLLVEQSDNTAWQALDRVLGQDKVDAYAASIGAPDCHQADDQCTAAEAATMIARLGTGSLLDSAHTSDLLGLLENTAFNDRINYYLGGDVVAHKVGMDGGVINDTGIVFAGHPFVVSVFTDSPDPDQGVEVIRLVARAAAQLYSR